MLSIHIRSVVDNCRWMPYKLLSYQQLTAGVPCPGCGRPWVGPQNDIDTDEERWRALHGECQAGRNGYTNAPVHCLRCCGVPPPSPAQSGAVGRILQAASDRREREEQAAQGASPEERRQQQEQEAVKRSKRIEKLEAELVRLRDRSALLLPRRWLGARPPVRGRRRPRGGSGAIELGRHWPHLQSDRSHR